MEGKHTPLPWDVGYDYPEITHIDDETGGVILIAEINTELDEAMQNGELIYRACNNYESLLKALEDVAATVRALSPEAWALSGVTPIDWFRQMVLPIVEPVIAQARGNTN